MVEVRASFREEAAEPGCGTLADRHHATLPTLSLADHQDTGGRVVVAVIELAHLAAPDAGGVEEFKNGPVAEADGIGGVWDGEEAGDFLGAQAFGQLPTLLAGEVEIGGGIGGDDAGAAEPGEEAPDAPETGELGVDCQRFASARAAVVACSEGQTFVHASPEKRIRLGRLQRPLQSRYSRRREDPRHRKWSGAEDKSLETTLFAQGVEIEKGDRPAGPEVLEEMAKVSLDRVIQASQLADLVTEIKALPEPPPLETRIPLWSNLGTLAAVSSLLGIFWIGRKLNGGA